MVAHPGARQGPWTVRTEVSQDVRVPLPPSPRIPPADTSTCRTGSWRRRGPACFSRTPWTAAKAFTRPCRYSTGSTRDTRVSPHRATWSRWHSRIPMGRCSASVSHCREPWDTFSRVDCCRCPTTTARPRSRWLPFGDDASPLHGRSVRHRTDLSFFAFVPESSTESPPGMRVLVADDDVIALTLMTAALAHLEHDVLAVGDAAAARERCQKESAPLVILDIT